MKVIVFFCVCFQLSFAIYAQKEIEDSITNLVDQHQKKDLAKNYLALAKFYSDHDDFTKSKHFAQKSLTLYQDRKDDYGILKAKYSLGSSYYLDGNYEKAEIYLTDALAISKRHNFKDEYFDICLNLGAIKQFNSKYKEAYNLYLETRFILEKQKKYDDLVLCYHNLASILAILDQKQKVKGYYDKIEAIIPQIKKSSAKIKAYSILASYYNDFGGGSKQSIEAVINYSTKGINLSKSTLDYSKISYLYNCLGLIYENKGDFKNSIIYYKNSLKYINFSNIKVDYYSYVGLYYSYVGLKNKTYAKNYLDSIGGHPLTKSTDVYKMDYLNMSYQFYKEFDLRKAIKNLEEIGDLKSKIQSKENVSIVSELEKKYNQTKNYNAILKLRNQKKLLFEKNKIKNLQVQVLVFSSLFLVLVIFISVYLYRQNIKNKKLKIVEIEQSLARVRMNPHFIFNVLSSLQTLSLDPKKAQLMPEYIHQFSKIMRQTLESSFTELISLEDELDFLTNYLQLQKLVKGDKFDFEFHLPHQLNSFDVLVPVMIFQPFIENAIEHGFAEMQSGGKIDLHFEEKNDLLLVKIMDNGSWNQSEGTKTYPSRAMEIINNRFLLLKKIYKKNATFELIKKQDGVEIEIRLPKFA